jgi:uncharacterized protein YndB with AHSA1/START domain
VAHHTYRFEAVAAAAPDVVFEVLVDAPGWASWAPMVGQASYEREGVPAPHGVGAVRSFGARVGPKSREEVVVYEAPRRFAYEIRSAPLPVAGYRSEVELTATDDGGTAVEWTGRFDTSVPGVAWLMRRSVAGFVRGLVTESEGRAAPT